MSVERGLEKLFQMSDSVWEKHANPWSVWTRYPCLPCLAFAIWSRVWLGWYSFIPIFLTCIWIWMNPRLFRKPKSTKNWASMAVLGERVFMNHNKNEMPQHHLNVIQYLKGITFIGFLLSVYGLVVLHFWVTVLGISITMLGKTWFLDRMVWLYIDMKHCNPIYAEWLYE